MRKGNNQRNNNKRKNEDCKHWWIALVGKSGKKIIPTRIYVCQKCGVLKVGKHTIRISRNRLDMGNKPIENASEVWGAVYNQS